MSLRAQSDIKKQFLDVFSVVATRILLWFSSSDTVSFWKMKPCLDPGLLSALGAPAGSLPWKQRR